MHRTVACDGSGGGDQRLGCHLSAEHAAVRHPLARPGEDVVARSGARVGEVERVQERLDGRQRLECVERERGRLVRRGRVRGRLGEQICHPCSLETRNPGRTG
ncbi:hypothetical protein ACFPRL_07395 [Pseudoclavibacter helvolus]